MPPPDDGNQYLPFDELMKLEKLDAITFKSLTLAYSPGGQLPNAVPRAYGGHAYAQSAWAASQTVAEGFLIYVCKCAIDTVLFQLVFWSCRVLSFGLGL